MQLRTAQLKPRAIRAASFVAILFLAALGTGCSIQLGGSDVKAFTKSVQEEESLVFGHLDMTDAPSRFDWIVVKRLKPLTDKPYYNFAIDGGLFFRTHTPPGTYKFDNFGGYSFMRQANITYGFPQQGKGEMDRVIPKTGIYFVGAYKYVKIKTGVFERDKFQIVRSDTPTEKELLRKLLDKAEHSSWKAALNKRIAEIK